MGKILTLISFFVILICLSAKQSQAQNAPVHTPRVLVIGIDPTDSNGASLANTYFRGAMSGADSATFELTHAQQTMNDFKDLSRGRIQYVLAGHLHLTSFPRYTNGYQFSVQNYAQCVWGRPEFNPTQCETQKWLFPYVQYVQEQQICQQAKAVNADEIWIYSPPYILAYEAFMIGPTAGFFVNGPDYTVVECEKHYIVVNAAYDTPNNLLHSYGHRIESTIDYLMRNFSASDRIRYWERFSARTEATRTSGSAFCGNVHFPFNYRFEYDYAAPTAKQSTCADFANFPNYTGAQTTQECSAWGCTDRGWEKYWFSFIPDNTGTTTIVDRTGRSYAFKNDWWYYLLYPENALRSESGVFPSQCLEDISGDGFIDISDYSILLTHFLTSVPAGTPADINADGFIDISDYSLLVRKFLTPCS